VSTGINHARFHAGSSEQAWATGTLTHDAGVLRAPDPDLHEYVRGYVAAYDLL